MGSSNYVTFGDFNNDSSDAHNIVSAPPNSSQNVMMHGSQNVSAQDSYPFGTGSNTSMELYASSHEMQQPQRPNRYPIRQQITYPRNPYVQPPTPPQPRYLDNPYYSYAQSASPSTMMMEPYMPTVSKTPPMRMPTTTPIHEAFSSSASSVEEEFDGKSVNPKLPFRSGNAWQGQTCVDINDHVVNCPICSQYYQNYSSMYIGIIILLGFIILIFLLKSIMEIRR